MNTTRDTGPRSAIEADGEIARPLGGKPGTADYADREAAFASSSEDWIQNRIRDVRTKIGQSRGSCKLEVFGPEVPANVIVELWAKLGPIRQLRQSVAGPLPEGLWFRRTDEPVETWEVWARHPGVLTEGTAWFQSHRLFFCKSDG